MMKQIDMAQMPRKELEKFAMEASGEAERLRAVVEAKEAELRLLRKEKFAGKSEKSRNDNVDEAQLSFFNDAEALARPDAEEPKLEKVKPLRKPKKKGRKKEKLEKLPIKRTEYVLSLDKAVCPQCGSGLAQMKKTVRKEVEIIPAKLVVHEHITQHYVCRECEKKELHTPILQAESPKPLLAASFLSPSMAAYVIDRKFENRDPVYKISSDFKSHALNLSDQTISNWILRTSEVYGRPLYERMWDHLLKSDYINADETTVQVLKEEGRNAQTKSYMWVFCDNHTAKPLVLFKYAASRNGDVAKKALENYKGIVQCDGYDGYNKVNGIIRTGCFAHVRRKFYEALKAVDPKLPEEASASEREALKRCNMLFELDRRAKEQPLEKRLQWKEAFVREEMEEFFRWLQEKRKDSALESEMFVKAVNYALNEMEYLKNYFADGKVELSNNLAERAVRPFAIGRKNWMFCKTPRGAQASAIWYSIVVTAKENGLIPFEYIKYVLESLRGKNVSEMPGEDIDRLLPWSDKLPENCYQPSSEQK